MPVKNPTESGQPKDGKKEPAPKSEQVKVNGDGVKRDVEQKSRSK